MCKKILLYVSALILSGCSFFGPKVGVGSITLDVAPLANDNAPIAVDFVAVRDPDLLKQLIGMSARQWFSEREQLQRDYRQQLDIWGLELVPGQFVAEQDFPLKGLSAAGLLVFASYNTPGAHRLRLDDQREAWLKFNSREMSLLNPADR